MIEYFPKRKYVEENVKFELDLYSYETKINLKNATRVDTSQFGTKVDLASPKSKVDKLDNVPTGINR